MAVSFSRARAAITKDRITFSLESTCNRQSESNRSPRSRGSERDSEELLVRRKIQARIMVQDALRSLSSQT
jgi:hypothetical protein